MDDTGTGKMGVAGVHGIRKVEFGGPTVGSKGLVGRKEWLGRQPGQGARWGVLKARGVAG